MSCIYKLRRQMANQTCDFCRTIFTPEQLHTIKYRHRAYYCKGSCPTQKGMMRMYRNIPPECQPYMKGVFESFVADSERGLTVFGIKTFDSLYKEVQRLYPYLTDPEYIELLSIIDQFEIKYGQYIDMVLNYGKYLELSGGTPKDLKTPADWASAIRNLIRNLTLANQAVDSLLEAFLNKKATEGKNRVCKGLKRCVRPCVTEKGTFKNICTYKGSPQHNYK
jgi:hypothetical protein